MQRGHVLEMRALAAFLSCVTLAASTNPFVSISLQQSAQRLFSVQIVLDSAFATTPWRLHRVRIDLDCTACAGPYLFLHVLSLDAALGNAVSTEFALPYDSAASHFNQSFWASATAWAVDNPAHDSPLANITSAPVTLVDDATWDPVAYYVTYFPDLLAACSVRRCAARAWGTPAAHPHSFATRARVQNVRSSPDVSAIVPSFAPVLDLVAQTSIDPVFGNLSASNSNGYVLSRTVDEGEGGTIDFNTVRADAPTPWGGRTCRLTPTLRPLFAGIPQLSAVLH